jgi:hypothetical protein
MGSRPTIRLTLPRSTTARTTLYPLVAATPEASGPAYALAATVTPDSPHIASGLAADGCASCHATHRAAEGPLVTRLYRTDPLRASVEPYDGNDFSLCITCHQEAPFADTSGAPNDLTAFPGHGFHLGLLENEGTGGVSIVTPGDGRGNALCAECHYNLHAMPDAERGLVRFSPNVLPSSTTGTLGWNAATQGCTLTCHGRDHVDLTFSAEAPAD